MGEVMVRPLADEDVPALMRLRAMWGFEDYGQLDDPGYEERFADWVVRNAATRRAWIAVDASGEAVGMMNMGLFERMPKPGQPTTFWGYLANAYVVPEFRNAGVGRMLLDALLAYARETGLARIVLHPSDRAIPFYTRAGFGPAEMLLVQHF
jgi:GNAT superfamily N-acetyltransferase